MGVVWQGGTAIERLSAGRITKASHLGARPGKPRQQIENATLIACQHTKTFGDWVTEYLQILALARAQDVPMPGPLILPGAFAQKGYVRHHLDQFGIEAHFVTEPVHVRSATMLHKQHYASMWSAESLAAYRAMFGVTPADPKPGSLLYLSREGVKSEQREARRYKSSETAQIVRDLGGKVVQTDALSPEEYLALAAGADIVISDHGSALHNGLLWKPSAILEIVPEGWWDPNFVYLAHLMGVRHFATIRGTVMAGDVLRDRISGYVTDWRG